MYKWIDSLRSSDSDHITEFTFIWQNKFSPSKMLPAGGCNLTAWFMKHALQDVKTTGIRSSKSAGTSTGQTSKKKTNWPAVFAGKDCFFNNFPECVARVPVSLWGSGGWGCVRSTLRSRSQPSATVRNRPQPFAAVRNRPYEVRMAVPMGSFAEVVILEVSNVSLLRFAWQTWHFVTFRRVLQRVENRFAWQAQYFCDVFKRCVAVFVAGAALWTCPSSFFVAGAAL